jgi:TP901 family phage tail tape measure protein
MVVLARAGQSVSEIGHTVEAVLDMARATGTEVASAAQFVVGALHEFQLEATQTRRVVDLMTRTANASPQSLEDLGNALKYIGPVAHSMSLSIEEVMRDLGLLAKFNIRGEQAGTSMRNLYMRMTSELNQRKFKETFKVDLIDEETGAVRSLLDVLAETKKNIESLGLAKSEVADAFKQVFSLRALPAAFSLTEVVDRAHEMEIALSNARSEAYNARKVMDGGLGGAFRALKSDAQEAGHSLIESIEEPLVEIVRSIESAIEKIDSFIDRNRMMIGGLMKYGSIAAGAALTMGGLAVAAGAASKSFSGLLGVARNFNKAAFDRFAGWGRQLTGRESIVKPEPKEPKINLRPIDEARTSVKALDEKLTDVARITSRAIVRFNNLAKGFYNVASKGQTAANSLSKLSTSVGLSFEHLRKFNAEFLKSKKAYGDARIKISALSRVVQTSTTRFNKASGALQKFGERNDYVGERVATLEKALLSFKEKTSGIQDSVKKISAAFRTAATEIGQASANYKSTASRLSQSLSVIASNLNRVVGRLNSGTRSFSNFQNAAEKLAASIKTSPSVYQTVEQAVDKFRERVRLASSDVREARRALDDAQKSLNAFGKSSGSNGVKTFSASLATASQAIQTIVGTSEQLVGALHASGEAFAFAAANAVLYRDALAKIVQYNKSLVDDPQGQKKKRNKKKNDDNDPPGGGGGGGGTPTRTDRVIEKADDFIKNRNREESVARKDSIPVSRADVQRKFGERVARRVDAKYAKRDRKDSERADKILATKRARDQAATELANLEARRTAPGLNVEQLAKLSSEIKEVKARIAGYDNTIKQLREARRNANAKSDVVSTNASRDAAERSLWDKHFWGTRPSLDERNAGAARRSRRVQKQIDSANTRMRAINKGYVSKLGVEFSRAAKEAQNFTSANLKLQPAIQAEIQALQKSATLKTASRNVDARLLDITQRLLAARQKEQAVRQTYRQNESKRLFDAAQKAVSIKTDARVIAALETLQRTQREYPRFLGRWLKEYRVSQENIRRLEKLYTQPSSASKDDVKLNRYLASNKFKDYNTPEAAVKHKEHIDFLKSIGATQSTIESAERDYKIRSYAARELEKAKEHQKNVVLGSSKKNLFDKHLAPFLAAKKELEAATSMRDFREQQRTERESDFRQLETARNNTLALEKELAQELGNRAAVQQATATAERELASATANRVAALNAANAVSNGALGTFSGTPTVDQLQTLAKESQDRQRALNFESHQKGQTLVSENNKLFPETPWKYQDGKAVPVTPYSPPSPPVSPSPPNNPPSPPNNPPKETDAQFLARVYQRLKKVQSTKIEELLFRYTDIHKEIDEHTKYAKSLPVGVTPEYDIWGTIERLEKEKLNLPRFLDNLLKVREGLKSGFQNALRNSPTEAASFVKHHSENLGNATDANRRKKQTHFQVSSQLWAESMLRSGKGEDAYQSVIKEIKRRGVRYANVMKAFDKRDADLKKQIDEQTKYAASLPAGTTPGHDVWGTVARLENERKENEKKRKRFAANESARASVLKRTQKGLGTGVIWQETAKWGEENAAKGRMNRPVADVTKGFDVAWKSAHKKLSKGGKLSSRDFNQLNELWNASGRVGTFGQFIKEGKAQQKKNKELEDKRSTSKGNWNLYNLHRTQYEESEQKRYALQNKIDAAKAPILRQAEEMRANGASDKAVRAYLQGQFAASSELKSLGQELNATQQASNAALVAMDSAKQKAQKYDKKHGSFPKTPDALVPKGRAPNGRWGKPIKCKRNFATKNATLTVNEMKRKHRLEIRKTVSIDTRLRSLKSTRN